MNVSNDILSKSQNYIEVLFLVVLLLGSVFGAYAQSNRGMRITIPDANGQLAPLYAQSFALLIGNSNYVDGWPKLPGVVDDLKTVQSELEKQGFEVTVLLNATYDEMDKAYKDFIASHGLDQNNRLLFYFAGHGHTEKQSYGGEMGYIVPIGTPSPYVDRNGFLTKAMDMQVFESYARRIQSKHALFVFDACFSGSIFALSRAIPENISYKTVEPVRQFITSGSADENVPDKSIFCQMFVAAIRGDADANKDGYVTGVELGEFLQEKVVNYSRATQHPQYGKIRDPNLDKGDIVFQPVSRIAADQPRDPNIRREQQNAEVERKQVDKREGEQNIPVSQRKTDNFEYPFPKPLFVGLQAGYASVSPYGESSQGGFSISGHVGLFELLDGLVISPGIEYFSASPSTTSYGQAVSDLAVSLDARGYIGTNGGVRPYIGVGLVYNNLTSQYTGIGIFSSSFSSSTQQLGCDFVAGVNILLNETVALAIEPKYFLTKDFNHFTVSGGILLGIK